MKYRTYFLVSLLIYPFFMLSCSEDLETATPDQVKPTTDPPNEARVDTFTFSSQGVDTTGIIFVPASFDTNSELPAIYLLDYKEQHFSIATDEFEQVVDAVRRIQNFDALVVTLEVHPNIDAYPSAHQQYTAVFKDMIAFVMDNYTSNSSCTFIARGSEAGVVMLKMMHENPEDNLFDNYIATDSPSSFNSAVISLHNNGNIPDDMPDKKLHFSFSSSNNSSSCLALIDSFEDAHYPWLTFTSVHYSTSSYTEIYPTAFEAGIRFVFDR